MLDDPEKPVTLNLAKDRYLDSLLDAPSDPTDQENDPEYDEEDLALEREALAETQRQAEVNRALGLSEDEREDLWAHFRDRQTIINTCNLVAGVLFLFGAHWALVAINMRLAGPETPRELQLFPSPSVWWFFPGFGALTLPWEITLQMWALFGNRRTVDLYRQWQKQSTFEYKGGAFKNELGLYRWFILLIALPIGTLTILALNMHSTIGPDIIRDCGYAFKPCNVYPLADAQRMTAIEGFKARDGSLTKRAGIVVDFKDGRRWSSADWGNFQNSVDPTLAAYLVRTTSLPLNSSLTEADIPSLSEEPRSK